jgi:hypothetical protein
MAVNEDRTMPKNKDLKRLVRSRMQKTGESYTTARAHLIARRAAPEPATPPPPRADLAALAGMRDAAVSEKTGRSWSGWVATLDAAGAMAMTHTAIAAMLHERFAVPRWWSQMVTVGYERIRGRRAKNQVGSGFSVSKTRTFAVPVATLAKAFAPRARAQWLDGKPSKERKTTAKVARWEEADGSWVDVFLLAKGAKSSASVQHTRLSTSADVARRRAQWADRLAMLAGWLDRRG